MDSHQSSEAPVEARILVVDDKPENIFAMERLLKPVDAQILTAQSGNEALSLMLRHDFAVVLLDVQMPEMDGIEVATLMRENDHTGRIPIVFVTALGRDEQHVFRGYESGAIDYLFKPIDPEVLRGKMRVFCQLYRQRRQLEVEVEARTRAQEKNQELIGELQDALTQIRTLRGIIPICSNCKKVRDDAGYWKQVETYIRDHSDATFTHGICPECMDVLYPPDLYPHDPAVDKDA